LGWVKAIKLPREVQETVLCDILCGLSLSEHPIRKAEYIVSVAQVELQKGSFVAKSRPPYELLFRQLSIHHPHDPDLHTFITRTRAKDTAR